MADNNSTRSPEEKRRRVNRIKKAILRFLIAYVLITSATIIIFHVRFTNLEAKYKEQIEEKSNTLGKGLIQVDDSDNLASTTDQHLVYLTFEDGPSEKTEEILDVLKDKNVKATFFVTGKTDDESKRILKRIVDEGHTIGMHSYSHKYSSIYSSTDSFSKDYKKIYNLIYETTGVRPKYYRFPGGSSNKMPGDDMKANMNLLAKDGVTYVDWNIASLDSSSSAYSKDELVENITSSVVKYKTSVVLLHDSNSKTITVEALPDLIESLQAISAEILPIDDNTDLIQQVKINK